MNKITLKIAILVVLLIFSVLHLQSQVIGYQCSFEDESERSLWSLNIGNQGENCVNKWYFGKPGAKDGEYGLFISSDGVSNNYQNKGVSVVASRTLHLLPGNYDIIIEWKGAGVNNDGLYVCWMPDSIPTNSVSSDALQKFVLGEGYDVGFKFAGSRLCGQTEWAKSTDLIYSDGTLYKLVFVWNNGVVSTTPPAACIDNIYIMQVGKCQNPKGLALQAQGSDVLLTWNGNSPTYDVRYMNTTSDSIYWIEHFGVEKASLKIDDLEEGMCTFQVRSVCDGILGEWISLDKYFHYPVVGCIDFLDINSSNCFYGTVQKPMQAKGVIDHGCDAEESRHTIHYRADEYDARVGGTRLRTVPEGETASIRLGNWHTQAEAECIEYTYQIDTLTSAVLILNYAVVLESPNHDSLSQPRFTLKILKEGKPLDRYGCGEAYFSSGFNTDGWETFPSANGGGLYKDWTTIGINLRDYHGEILTVQLTTYDCIEKGHYGYAYFTLACSDGKIEALSCGESPENSFKAPEGFKYRWYLPDAPNDILSTEQIFTVPSTDTLTYNLDVIQPTNENCYYTLSASTLARYPRARGRFESTVEDCQNIVNFADSSYVILVNQYTKETIVSDETVQSVEWNFGDGNTSTELKPQHIYPERGGKYMVTLTAKMSGGACSDVVSFELNLPELGTKRDTIHAVICQGESYSFRGKNYFSTGCYSDTMQTIYNCDSIITLDLYVADSYDSLIVDTICSTDYYVFNGEPITKSGKYVADLKSMYGCDSTITLNIVVYETLLIDIDTVVNVCIDDENIHIPYSITSGRLGDYGFVLADGDTIEGVEIQGNTFVIPLPKDLKPNRYRGVISFGKQSCGKEQEEVMVDLLYSHDVIAQRWDDVLAVKNKEYNGGYDFIAFQWYRNSEIILGATNSILYVENGLNSADEYSVLLTRADDGVAQRVCGVFPQELGNVSESAVVILKTDETSSLNVEVAEKTQLKMWSIAGVLVNVYDLNVGVNNIVTSNLSGIYILEFVFTDGSRRVEKVNICR